MGNFRMQRFYVVISLYVVFFLTKQGVVADKKPGVSHTYALYMSKYVRPGVSTEIVLEILQSENPVNVEAVLNSDDFSSNITAVIGSGEIQSLKFQEIPLDYKGGIEFNVTVVGTDSVSGRVVFRNKTKRGHILFQKKFVSMFIQTDKAIYQPSHTIKFRAVITTPDLLPYTGNVTYKLIDPDDNVILMKKNVMLENGVAGSQYKLGRYSTNGLWKVSYTVNGYEDNLGVEVQEYKLPKFQTKIELDQTYLTPNSSVLSGRFFAKYTFGELVKGMARLEISSSQNSYSYSYVRPSMILRKYEVTNSPTKFSIPMKEIRPLGWEKWRNELDLHIRASIMEKNTREKQEATSKITIHKKRIKIDVISKPEHFKPGLPYRAYIKVTEQDGTLLSAEETSNTKLNVSVTYRDNDYERKIYTLDINDDGIAVLDILLENVKDNAIYFMARIGQIPKSRYMSDWNAQRFLSPSDTFIQISTTESSYSVGDNLTFDFYSTERAEKYTMMVIARGKVVLKQFIKDDDKAYNKSGGGYKYKHGFSITSEMSPSIDVVVSFTRKDGEIVADGRKFLIQATLPNTVTLSTSTNKTKVGTDVDITVDAAPGSFVGLRAIDQSVLLLRSGNDITQEKIFSDLSKYGTSSRNNYRYGSYYYGWRYWFSADDVSQVFEESGILVMTDALVYSRRPSYYGYGYSADSGGAFARSLASPAALERSSYKAKPNAASNQERSEEKVVTRTRFPESWIWADSYTGDNGSTTFTYNTPDTITTWELSSFGISDVVGLGVTKQNSKVTVFRSFFITLDLPPSMIQGEILNMRVMIFNYHDTDVTANVTLRRSEWYKLEIVGDDPIASGRVRNILVRSKDSTVVVFPVKFRKPGQAKIFVEAISSRDGDAIEKMSVGLRAIDQSVLLLRSGNDITQDAIEKMLVIKPTGIPETISRNLLIDRLSDNDPTKIHIFDVEYPQDIVKGSARIKCSVSGSILGNSLDNLGSLLRMPGGCGEQTMATFAPDIYITLYLQRANKLSKEIEEKASSHIRHGYQNMLRYQHNDGSFSAFGPSSGDSGSTWLTAFVLKCFIAAKNFSDELIESEKINKAVSFILNQQQEDGSFKEPGRVISWNLQGGVESKETMAAYIIIALTEENFEKNETAVSTVLEKAQGYLEGRINDVSDIYTLSVMAYALTLVKSNLAEKVIERIESRSSGTDDERYWEETVIGASPCTDWFCRYYSKDQTASSVEMTSYVLLTYVASERRSELLLPVIRWLVGRRGAFGGYYSTQDTVMGIQALTGVAGLFAGREQNLSIAVSHDKEPEFGAKFTIIPENSIILQTEELQVIGQNGNVSLQVEGEGFADVQLVMSYNVPAGSRIGDPFVLSVEMKEEDDVATLLIEATINEEREEVLNETGMFVITVELISGYTIDDEEATRHNKDTRLIELVGEEVTGYFDKLTIGEIVKMELVMTRYAKVGYARPKLIKGFDYYNPERMAVRQYRLRKTGGGVCQVCGTDCVGCPAPPRRDDEGNLVSFYCQEADFPCPDFMDGLYYDPKSQVANRMKTITLATKRPCSVSGVVQSSQKYPGPPGTYINGTVQSIDCARTLAFEQALKRREGFAIAMLFYPTEKSPTNVHYVFSIGKEKDGQPTLELRKQNNGYMMKFRIDGYEFTTTYYQWNLRSGFVLNQWSHVMLAFRGGPFPDLYINNRKIGATNTAKWIGKSRSNPEGFYKLNIGDPGIDGNRGYVGLVSSLDFWTQPLSDGQIQSHYRYYFDMMVEKDPLFTEGQAQHAIPVDLWSCLEPSYVRASKLKVFVGEEPALCEKEFGGSQPSSH